jgi:hypothetical protein
VAKRSSSCGAGGAKAVDAPVELDLPEHWLDGGLDRRESGCLFALGVA